MKILRIISALLASLAFLTACDHDEPRSLYFIGDSIVARWDLDSYFSGYAVYNDGKSGARYSYLYDYAGAMKDRTVVVMIGTNDMGSPMDDVRLRAMAADYVAAVTALDARRVYLYSVLPRDFSSDFAGKNDMIRRFNAIVQESVASVPEIVYIDVFDDFLRANGSIDRDLYTDRLHLSPSGYEILSKALLDKL